MGLPLRRPVRRRGQPPGTVGPAAQLHELQQHLPLVTEDKRLGHTRRLSRRELSETEEKV